MKKTVINRVIAFMLVVNMAFGFGWLVEFFENFITTKTVTTVFLDNGGTKEYVTIRNINHEIIDEYVVIRETES